MTRRRVSDALTSFAAQTFPPSRRADGRVVRDCARDAIDSEGLQAMAREPLSLAVAGLRVRLGVARAGVLSAPWRAALATLPLPLAAALLCVWTFGFVPRYDHWPLDVGWITSLSSAPYLGFGTEKSLTGTPSFFQGSGVDIGAASLLPTLLLIGAALTLPRGHERSVRVILDRVVLGLLPTAVALIHLLPREKPQETIGVSVGTPGTEPKVFFGDPYPHG